MRRSKIGFIMKLFNGFFIIISLILMLACSSGKKGSARQQFEDKMDQTYNSARHFTVEQKQAIEKRFQTRIDSLTHQISDLRAQSSRLGTVARDKLDSLMNRKESLQTQLDSLRDSSGRAWDVLDEHLKKSYQELKEGVDEAGKELVH